MAKVYQVNKIKWEIIAAFDGIKANKVRAIVDYYYFRKLCISSDDLTTKKVVAHATIGVKLLLVKHKQHIIDMHSIYNLVSLKCQSISDETRVHV